VRRAAALGAFLMLAAPVMSCAAADDTVIAAETGLERLAADTRAAKFKNVHSVLVYKGGELLLEEYFTGSSDHIDFEGGIKRIPGPEVAWNADRQHYVASVTKAVTGILTGIALDELGLSEHALIKDLLPPDLEPSLQGKARSLTLHDLLTMTAGFRWDEWTSDDLVKLWQSDDFAKTLFEKENMGAGSEWRYNSALPNLVLRILEYRLGKPLQVWADERLFGPLGIHNYRWDKQPTGTPEGGARLHLTPRDMMKIGVTVLDGGMWQGERIIPADWVTKMTRHQASPEGAGYGYYFWLREVGGVPYISADGDGGQQINIFPEADMVVVMTQGNYGEWPLYMEQAQAMMRDYILPVLHIKKPRG
jgi:CubicO group peptidase (beta-lactamase class C family)